MRDMIAAGDIALMINTPFGHATRADGYERRLEAVKHGVTHVTNLAGAQAMVAGMEVARLGGLTAVALQDLPQWGKGSCRDERRAGPGNLSASSCPNVPFMIRYL